MFESAKARGLRTNVETQTLFTCLDWTIEHEIAIDLSDVSKYYGFGSFDVVSSNISSALSR